MAMVYGFNFGAGGGGNWHLKLSWIGGILDLALFDIDIVSYSLSSPLNVLSDTPRLVADLIVLHLATVGLEV